jgi:AcrR family transcriptional regulator
MAEPGLRSRQKAKRRDEIIAAAQALFESQGLDATTMADIAAAAGISAPTVFNYFGSKDGVLIALISDGSQRGARTRTPPPLERKHRPRNPDHEAFHAHLKPNARNRRQARLALRRVRAHAASGYGTRLTI